MRASFAIAILLLVLAAPLSAHAAIITAMSCTAAVVQASVNVAATGDTVKVPAGSCNNGTMPIVIDQKTITLQGAGDGAGGTTITMTSVNLAMRIGDPNQNRGNASRITGFKIVNGYVTVDGDGWRIDHVTIVGDKAVCGVSCNGISANGFRPDTPYGPTGLIDHVTLVDSRVVAIGYPDIALKEATLWSSPLGLGDANAVYVEDSTFLLHGQPNAFDCNYGGRFVLRNSIVYNSSIDAHSVQGTNRACRRWELYNNRLELQPGSAYFGPVFLRGGTGVLFNNTVVGAWKNQAFIFDQQRAGNPPANPVPNACNGTSPLDGNVRVAPAVDAGWPCRDQIGIGRDTSRATSATPWPVQSVTPVYLWNNTINGASANTVVITNRSNAWIQEGRDFVTGVPAPGYKALVYPHPRQTVGAVIVVPPTSTATDTTPPLVRVTYGGTWPKRRSASPSQQ